MGALTTIFNVASNKPPRYHDEPEESEAIISGRAELDLESDPDEPLDSSPNGAGATSIKSWTNNLTRYIPLGIQRSLDAVAAWTKGPNPPRPWSIKPFFPAMQTAPIKLLDLYFPRPLQRFWLLSFLYFIWLLCFSLVLEKSAFAADVPGYGSPARLSCGTSFWNAKNGCGLDGNDCRPFSNDTLVFRCPANCLKTHVLEPHVVGAEEVIYRPMVIGGAPQDGDSVADGVYRADSFICGSAIHAGFISNIQGGCGVLELVGEHTGYPATKRHDISSVAFNSSFPRSYRFIPGATSSCRDLRWPLLGVTVTCTALLSLFTTSPAVFFSSTFIAIFIHVGLVSDPPTFADYYSLISLSIGRLLPSTFIMYVMYRACVHRTLHNLTAQFEKTILWLGGCWIGALNNETFDKIPIQRLTPHDIAQQPGAIPALICVVLTLIVTALGQAWAIRIEGRMRLYLLVYAILVGGVLTLLAIPHMNLRIHHYILGLLLLPGTAMQNRPSLFFQGLLVGLFINGIARWGYASILETPDALRGDNQLGSSLPALFPPLIAGASNITFTWAWPPPKSMTGATQYDGISVLVNDVERFRSYPDGASSRNGRGHDRGGLEFVWERDEHDEGRPEYFRFGYMHGSSAMDYTKAGIWDADGKWTPMGKGAS